jgi:hypothetical protein
MGSQIFWNYLPFEDGAYSEEPSYVKTVAGNGTNGEVLYTSNGRLITAPETSDGIITIVPREDTAGVYYTMTAIDPCLYEAASIDGAGRFHKIMNVTLPGIRSTFVILLIMNIGHLMEAGFEIQYLLGSSVVMDWSQTIDVFVLQYGISKQQYGVATAAGMFKSIVAIILLVSANAISRRLGEDTLI